MLLKFLYRKKRNLDEKDISEKDMEKILEKEKGKIIDVRSPQEYEEGHMKGAILIPEYEINKKAKEILKNKEEVIIVYCSSGGRSKKAQRELIDMGYKKVYNLYNGYQNY